MEFKEQKEIIERKIEVLKEYLEYGLTYGEYLDVANAFEDIKNEINKFKWKPISEYNRREYDWVLIKYFDDEYECIPQVAEMRQDNNWYNADDNIIPFEVKYFFDMQNIKQDILK